MNQHLLLSAPCFDLFLYVLHHFLHLALGNIYHSLDQVIYIVKSEVEAVFLVAYLNNVEHTVLGSMLMNDAYKIHQIPGKWVIKDGMIDNSFLPVIELFIKTNFFGSIIGAKFLQFCNRSLFHIDAYVNYY